MTFCKRGLIVALTLAFAATSLFVQVAEAKVTKGQASVAKRSGKLYINQRQYDKALEQYMIAAEGNPGDSEVQYYLGWLYSQKELFEEMNEHYDLATNKKWKKKVDTDRKELWTRYYNMAVKGMNAQRFDFAMLSNSISPLRLTPMKPTLMRDWLLRISIRAIQKQVLRCIKKELSL